MPAAGRPIDVSSTWVEIVIQAAFSRRSLVIRRCSAAATSSSCAAIVLQPLVEQRENLGGVPAGRADDEHVAEALLVRAIRLGERVESAAASVAATPACSRADEACAVAD